MLTAFNVCINITVVILLNKLYLKRCFLSVYTDHSKTSGDYNIKDKARKKDKQCMRKTERVADLGQGKQHFSSDMN